MCTCKIKQAFFNVTEANKEWVMKSARKKWRAFKCFLKATFWKSELTWRQNYKNGCQDRIPDKQWRFLVRFWRTDRSMVSVIYSI
jgi:hypothetical protein